MTLVRNPCCCGCFCVIDKFTTLKANWASTGGFSVLGGELTASAGPNWFYNTDGGLITPPHCFGTSSIGAFFDSSSLRVDLRSTGSGDQIGLTLNYDLVTGDYTVVYIEIGSNEVTVEQLINGISGTPLVFTTVTPITFDTSTAYELKVCTLSTAGPDNGSDAANPDVLSIFINGALVATAPVGGTTPDFLAGYFLPEWAGAVSFGCFVGTLTGTPHWDNFAIGMQENKQGEFTGEVEGNCLPCTLCCDCTYSNFPSAWRLIVSGFGGLYTHFNGTWILPLPPKPADLGEAEYSGPPYSPNFCRATTTLTGTGRPTNPVIVVRAYRYGTAPFLSATCCEAVTAFSKLCIIEAAFVDTYFDGLNNVQIIFRIIGTTAPDECVGVIRTMVAYCAAPTCTLIYDPSAVAATCEGLP